MANIYDVNGNIIPISGGSTSTAFVQSPEFDRVVKGIAHRGFSSVAPENTLPAYQLAKTNGFFYVETDVQFTSDNVPVLLHDNTIDATSDGTGAISSMTFEQVRQYDFGSWKSATYAGTKIPSFEEFMILCRDIVLHPYIELKAAGTTQAQANMLMDIVDSVGMTGKVTWISFYYPKLAYIIDRDPTARIGVLAHAVDASTAQGYIDTATGLSTGSNEVFIDSNLNTLTAEGLTKVKEAGFPYECWTVDVQNDILNADPYVTGFTSNSLNAQTVLYNANIS